MVMAEIRAKNDVNHTKNLAHETKNINYGISLAVVFHLWLQNKPKFKFWIFFTKRLNDVFRLNARIPIINFTTLVCHSIPFSLI
jgi:hypothetical protein